MKLLARMKVRQSKRKKSPTRRRRKKHRGLGDWIAHWLHKIGIAKKPGCNCGDRQKLLNKWFPFK